MKKISLLLCAVSISALSFAQSIGDIRDLLSQGNWDILKAKSMIDKFIANPKNASKIEAWYYKGYIYNALSKSDSLKAYCNDCKMEAFNAFKKYQELDPKNVLMIVNQNASLFDIYNNYFDLAAKAFNSSDYNGAFINFQNAGIVSSYIKSKGFDYNGFKFPDLDTSLVANTALAARLAKRDSDAVIYYRQLADANVSDDKYLPGYEFVAYYYKSKKDHADFQAAVDKGQKLFPNDDYWIDIQIQEVESNGGSQAEIFKKYDELLQEKPNDYALAYDYSVDLYNYVYANDNKPLNADSYKAQLHDLLKKTIAIKTTPEANLLMARFLYNSSFDDGDAAKKIKGATPESIKKRKDLNAKAAAELDECTPYALAAADDYAALKTLKPVQKANDMASLTILKNIYDVKKDAAKSAEYDAKLKALE